MLIDSDQSIYINAFAFVKRSKNRQQIIKIISNNFKTPSEIVEEMDVRFSLISRTLSELKDKNIVECINENDKTGRLYKLTENGLKIYNELMQE